MNLTGSRKNKVWRLNVGLLNNKELLKEIKGDITRYREENDNGEVIPIILWDALKAVIREKLIARTPHLKRTKLELHKNLTEQLKEFEKQPKNTNDPEALAKVKEIRSKIDKILLTDYRGGEKSEVCEAGVL